MSTIQAYLDQHQLDKTLTEALNACVKGRYDDPYGYLSKFLIQKCPSVILKVNAGYVLDNRGFPVTYVDVHTHRGVFRGTCPNASNAGIHECPELKDDDPTRFHGHGVMRAVYTIQEKIAPGLIGKDPRDQQKIDQHIRNWSKYANVSFPLSSAICKAGACESNMSLIEYLRTLSSTPPNRVVCKPVCAFLRFGTYMEIHIASIDPDWQEAVRKMSEVQMVTPEPERFDTPEDALRAVAQSIEEAGLTGNVFMGIQMNASEFITEDNSYALGEAKFSRDELIEVYLKWIDEFNLMFIEDPFDQDDCNAFETLKKAADSTGCMVFGTHLYASSAQRMREAWTHGVVLKPSAVGTVTALLQASTRANDLGMVRMISGRTGDVTDETFDTEFAHGVYADYIRFKRLEKFNLKNNIL